MRGQYGLGATTRGDELVAVASGEVQVRLGRMVTTTPGATTCVEGARFPVTRANLLALEALAAPTTTTPEYRAVRQRLLHSSEDLLADEGWWRVREVDRELRARGWSLMTHQLQFLRFALDRRGVLNASEQGTGKTTMALACLGLWGARTALVLCDRGCAGQWTATAESMFGDEVRVHDLTVGKMEERARELRLLSLPSCSPPARVSMRGGSFGQFGMSVVLLNYEVLTYLLPDLLHEPWDAVVADESWRLQTPGSKRTRAVLKLADRRRSTSRFLALTGTPIGQHAGNLWAQVRFVEPTLAPMSYGEWSRAFAHVRPIHVGGRVVDKFVGVRDPAALMAQVESAWWRATKATCLDLPPKARERVTLPPTAHQVEWQRRVERSGGDGAWDADATLPNPATRDQRLHQLSGGTARGWSFLNNKEDWLRSWAARELAHYPDVRAVVWCAYNDEVSLVVAALESALGAERVQGVTGANGPFPLSSQALDQVKRAFRDGDGPQVLVCQVHRMAAGHDLQAASWVIYWSNAWSNLLRAQSEDRTHRHGTTGTVRYVDLVTHGMLDEKVLDALETGQDFAARLGTDTTGL